MAKPRESVYSSGIESQDVPHPKRFPGQNTEAAILALPDGRHVNMTLADEDSTDMQAYGEESRNCSYF